MIANLQISECLNEIPHPFKGILLDAYGVFWGGNSLGLLPGSKEAMEKMISDGKIVGILSNTTQLAEKEIEKLKKYGLIQGKHFHFFMTSGELTKTILTKDALPFSTPKKKFWLFGSVHPKFSSHHAIFTETPFTETEHIHEADFIYLSIPHLKGEDQTDPLLFRENLFNLLETGLPMLCTNPDLFAHEGHPPRAVVRQGSLAAMFEEMGGQVFYIGKPSELMFTASMTLFSQYQIIDSKEILMVGDTPETDIRGARLFGISSALMTKTGMMADRIAKDGLEMALKSLPSQDVPTFLIGSL